jgi:hypothetical protein
MRARRLARPWLLAVAATVACSPIIRYTAINASPSTMTPRSPEAVEVFSSGPPTRPHVDVALIEVEDPPFGLETSELLQSLRARAAEAGCDGVVVTAIAVGRHDRRVMYGTCIRYAEP